MTLSTLYRYELDFDLSMEFAKNHFSQTSTLASELVNLVDFKAGAFFTLLTAGSDLQRLYEFEAGAILPQHPLIITETNGKQSFSREKASIKKQLNHYIFQKLNSNKGLHCVLDDVMRRPNDLCLQNLYEKKCIYLYKDEVLYVINKDNMNHDLISKCIWGSFAYWHSGGVLTEANCFDNNNHVLSLENIQTICKKTKIIIIGAYDGEGYVLWEKKE